MLAGGVILGLVAQPAAATEPGLDAGDTAWMLTSTALVLMMTIPGLALFYGGMVRKKNVLAMAMQSFAIAALASVLWAVAGYSLAFTEGNAFIGGLGKAMLAGVTVDALTGTVPETVFITFQMAFAIITPALITGAFADRMKFSSMLLFSGLWLLVVYVPVAHWVWGGGFLGSGGVLDYAGGTVVHINAGVAGLVAALVVGPRKGYGTENLAPHNLTIGDRGGAAVGGVVRVQRRLGAGRRRPRRHGHGGDPDRRRRRRPVVDARRMGGARKAERPRHRLRRRRRPGGHHPGVRFRGPGRRLVIGLAAGLACYWGPPG